MKIPSISIRQDACIFMRGLSSTSEILVLIAMARPGF